MRIPKKLLQEILLTNAEKKNGSPPGILTKLSRLSGSDISSGIPPALKGPTKNSFPNFSHSWKSKKNRSLPGSLRFPSVWRRGRPVRRSSRICQASA